MPPEAQGEKAGPQYGAAASPLLDVRGLTIAFGRSDPFAAVVEGIDLAIRPGEILALVGESGCGKSVTSLSLMRLLPSPPACVSGSIVFDRTNLLDLPETEMRRLRGSEIAMIFQEPMTSLNPAYTIGDQIAEAIVAHEGLGYGQAWARAVELLTRVRMPAPARRARDYPHMLSGGMRQRAMIAIALACGPRLLIADEPTTALDVTIQASILELLREILDGAGTAILLITHDLGVVAELADRVAVMYAGRIVEEAAVDRLFDDPQHPYTIGLMGSVPVLGGARDRLPAIDGTVPAPGSRPLGCVFSSRCPFARPLCEAGRPPLLEVAPGHKAACRRAPLEAAA